MPIRNRRQGREAALRTLYQMEVGGFNKVAGIENLNENNELPPEILEFAIRLIEGVVEKVDELDEYLTRNLNDWTLERLVALDRNILRMATYELLYCPEVPPAVTINEAVTIIKKYSTAESGKFVNGVLGGVLKESPKANGKALVENESLAEEIAIEDDSEPVVVEISENSPEMAELAKVGAWTLRAEEKPS